MLQDELSQLLGKVKDLISENESLHAQQKLPIKHLDVGPEKRYEVRQNSVDTPIKI